MYLFGLGYNIQPLFLSIHVYCMIFSRLSLNPNALVAQWNEIWFLLAQPIRGFRRRFSNCGGNRTLIVNLQILMNLTWML